MKTLTIPSLRRRAALLRSPRLLLRSITAGQVRSILIICCLAAYAVLLYFIFTDALFDTMMYVSRRRVEICFVCLFSGLAGMSALFSMINANRFTYLERGCLLFIFAASALFLFFRYPELFERLPQ